MAAILIFDVGVGAAGVSIYVEQPGINGMNELLTMHFGPHDVLLNISLDFNDRLSSAEVERTVSGLR